MISSIVLTDFQGITDTVIFGSGLNVIRGGNERGKSRRLRAASYAWFGSKGLPKELVMADLASWDKPGSKPKVTIFFRVNSEEYQVTRSASGAELFKSGQLTVTGQTEVTKYCEALLGTSADAATKLMMANQSSLRGALQDGPAAAVTLIENLANFDLIDSIVGLVQEKLPSGNTVALQSQIDTLTAQLEEPVTDETLEASAALKKAENDCAVAGACLNVLLGKLQTFQPSYDAAQQANWKVLAAQEAVRLAEKEKQDADKAVGSEPVPVDLSAVPALEKAIAEAGQRAAAQSLLSQLASLKEGDEWEGSAESLAEEVARISELKEQAVTATDSLTALGEWRLKLNTAKGRLITATHCAFCDKDLSDVPEVTTFNATWTPKILEAEAAIAVLTEKLRNDEAEIAIYTRDIKTLVAIQNAASARASLYQKASSYIALDEGFVPARWSWHGPDLSLPVDTSAAQKLKNLQNAASLYQRELGRYQAAVQRADKTLKVLVEARNVVDPLVAAAQGCEEVFSKYSAACGLVAEAEGVKVRTDKVLAEAALAANYAHKVHALKLASRSKLVEQKETATQTLKSTVFNNALLKKLRAAKPQVANKLWAVVLGTVSQTFSAIRGQASVVARGADGFTVDGRSVGGLSGSTLDALGLAIRIALTKTFLPNTRFMVLDEASSACDSDRESAMVGAVISADFDQVIWVTHSDAVQSSAAHAIEI